MFHPLEHTVAVTSSGIWVLTLLADELGGVRGALSKVIQALRRGGVPWLPDVPRMLTFCLLYDRLRGYAVFPLALGLIQRGVRCLQQ